MQKVVLKLDWYSKVVLTVIAFLLLGLLLKPYYTVERVVKVEREVQGNVNLVDLGDRIKYGLTFTPDEYRHWSFGGPRYPLVVEIKK